MSDPMFGLYALVVLVALVALVIVAGFFATRQPRQAYFCHHPVTPVTASPTASDEALAQRVAELEEHVAHLADDVNNVAELEGDVHNTTDRIDELSQTVQDLQKQVSEALDTLAKKETTNKLFVYLNDLVARVTNLEIAHEELTGTTIINRYIQFKGRPAMVATLSLIGGAITYGFAQSSHQLTASLVGLLTVTGLVVGGLVGRHIKPIREVREDVSKEEIR